MEDCILELRANQSLSPLSAFVRGFLSQKKEEKLDAGSELGRSQDQGPEQLRQNTQGRKWVTYYFKD